MRHVTLSLLLSVLGEFAMLGVMGWNLDIGTSAILPMAVGIGADYAIYFIFRLKEELEKTSEFDRALLLPHALAPEALAALVAPLGPTTLAIGDGAIAFRDALERSGSFIPRDDSVLHRVTATNHCRLAERLQESLPDEVRPDYLRAPDAEIAHRSR